MHRAFYLQHFRHYYYCCCNNCCRCRCCGCGCHINSSLTCSPRSQDKLQYLYSSSVQQARNMMRLSLDGTHARGAQIRYVTRTYVWRFGEESACATGRWAFACSDSDGEYVNSVWWKRIHPAVPLDWCQPPHVHRKPRVPIFVNALGGVYPLFHPPVYFYCIPALVLGSLLLLRVIAETLSPGWVGIGWWVNRLLLLML